MTFLDQFRELDVRIETGVATITLNRPHTKNAITSSMKSELLEAIDHLESAHTTRVLVLRGADRNFCSGADLGELENAGVSNPLAGYARIEFTQRIVQRLQESRLIVVTVIEGVAAGGGLTLAWCGDVVLCSQSVRFVPAFAKRGLIPDAGLSLLLSDALGRRGALSFCLRSQEMSAEEAKELGLVDLVASDRDVDDVLKGIVDDLVSIPSEALTLTKLAFSPRDSRLVVEGLGQAFALQTRPETKVQETNQEEGKP